VGSLHTSEWFNTAGRSVKTGLIACVIVSQRTWEATILQSSNVAGRYGVAGPFWHASGATVQVLLFGAIAIEVKREAPSAHTVCEIVRARWVAAEHVVFLAFCLATNVIVTAMLLLGGSAVVNALTGVDVYAASFLIPLGVVVYTLAGGLKATTTSHSPRIRRVRALRPGGGRYSRYRPRVDGISSTVHPLCRS
jgi:urea-proton symporter